MNQFYIFIIASVITTSSFANPLVTVSCDMPKGYSMEYGVSSFERIDAAISEKQEPTNSHFKEAMKDGYENKPTFIISSDKKKATVVWAESAKEIKHREQAKSLNAPYCCGPPPTTLFEAAMRAGGPDNISIALVRVEKKMGRPPRDVGMKQEVPHRD